MVITNRIQRNHGYSEQIWINFYKNGFCDEKFIKFNNLMTFELKNLINFYFCFYHMCIAMHRKLELKNNSEMK